MEPARASTICNWAALAIVSMAAIASLVIRAQIPMVAIPDAGHDDGLFASLAHNIATGRWLGHYNSLTLVKGPGYPIFLAVCELLRLPVKLTEHALYLLAAGALAHVCVRICGSRLAGAAVFVALALNPALWAMDAQRITRDAYYTGITLAVFALTAWFMLCEPQRSQRRLRVLIAALTGFLLALFMLTREEGVWLLPALCVLAVGLAWRRVRFANPVRSKVLMLPVAAAFGFAALYGLVIGLNCARYGLLFVSELRGGTFPAAYGAIMRIETTDWQPRIHFSRQTAEALYAHSPSARELADRLPVEEQIGWRAVSCSELRLDPCPPGIGGGWFVWALREAASNTNHFESPRHAQAFWQGISDDINAACEEEIRCGPRRSSMTPPFRRAYAPLLAQSAEEGVGALLDFGRGRAGWRETSGVLSEIINFSKVVGPLPTARRGLEESVLFEGWAASPHTLSGVSVVAPSGSAANTEVRVTDGADVVQHFESQGRAGMSALRFEVETECRGAECLLVVLNDTADPLASLQYEGLYSPRSYELGEATIYMSNLAQRREVFRQIDPVSAERLFLRLEAFATGYSSAAKVAAWLILPAFLCALVMLFKGTVADVSLAILLSACLAAIATRLALLAYIDVSSWDAMTNTYLLPATPFAILAIMLSALVISRATWICLRTFRVDGGRAEPGRGPRQTF